MEDRTPRRDKARTGVQDIPVVRRLRGDKKGPQGFIQPHILRWVILGVASLSTLVILAFLEPELSNIIVHASTALALFFLLFALGLVVGLGRRAPVVATVVTGLLYGLTAWTPLVGVRPVFVLGVLVAFFIFALAGFNVLFVVEEVLFDIHRNLHIRGTWWNAIPTFIILGTTPLVYWLLPELGLRWPTLKIAMPFVVLLLAVAWIARLQAGPHAIKLVQEAHFLSIGTITGAGLADIVTMLGEVEGIIPSIIAYLTIIVTWLFVSFNTLQRAQYFLRGADVLPWMALLFASAFAVLAHVQFLYGTAGAPGLAAVSEVRIWYLVFGVWVGLAFFVIRGTWRFVRFVRDEKKLGPRTRRTAGRFARIMEELLGSSSRAKRATGRVLQTVDRGIPGSRTKSNEARAERKAESKQRRDRDRERR